jgi:hypothetical protein
MPAGLAANKEPKATDFTKERRDTSIALSLK